MSPALPLCSRTTTIRNRQTITWMMVTRMIMESRDPKLFQNECNGAEGGFEPVHHVDNMQLVQFAFGLKAQMPHNPASIVRLFYDERTYGRKKTAAPFFLAGPLILPNRGSQVPSYFRLTDSFSGRLCDEPPTRKV